MTNPNTPHVRTFDKYHRTILIVILGIAAVVAAGLGFLLSHDLGYLFGWLLGCAAGVVVFRQRVVSVMGMATGTPGAWGRATIRSSLFQFGVVLAALLAAALSDRINLYTCCAGVFMERLVLVADGLLRPNALAEPEQTTSIPDERSDV